MADRDARPPVLVLAPPRFVAPLGVMRSLAQLGARVYGLEHAEPSIAGSSRFCAGRFRAGHNGRPVDVAESVILDQLVAAGRKLGGKAVLMAASDEWAIFVAAHRSELAVVFSLPDLPLELAQALTSKATLHDLAMRHGVPTPRILVPHDSDQVLPMAKELGYPVLLKPVVSLPGAERVALAHDAPGTLDWYHAMGGAGQVLLQEHVPGDDRDVWMFNGYFDRGSRCLFGATARKIRQHPPGMGVCAVGVCERNEQVLQTSERFLADIGYRGPVDIDYRWDRRDGTYKVLDVNPRLGGAFRLMVDRNGLDVARAMYLDLTGERVPAAEAMDGRKWVLESADLIAFRHYRALHGLGLRGWLSSLRGDTEPATFSFTDPVPFAVSMRVLVGDTLGGRLVRAAGPREPEGLQESSELLAS